MYTVTGIVPPSQISSPVSILAMLHHLLPMAICNCYHHYHLRYFCMIHRHSRSPCISEHRVHTSTRHSIDVTFSSEPVKRRPPSGIILAPNSPLHSSRGIIVFDSLLVSIVIQHRPWITAVTTVATRFRTHTMCRVIQDRDLLHEPVHSPLLASLPWIVIICPYQMTRLDQILINHSSPELIEFIT